jgi:hypothetical protein
VSIEEKINEGERQMRKLDFWRLLSVRWLYLATLGHFLAGLLMALSGGSMLFSHYNQSALETFALDTNQSAVSLQIWWLAIFGATLQAFSVLLAALIYLGNKFRERNVWLLILVAILIWAPQDIYFSAMQGIWLNVWVDLAALVSLLPPLIFLMRCDGFKS